MKDLILLAVKNFIESCYEPGRVLILGCSGGPDSLALLHLLKECQRFFPFPLHVAHVDHNWRDSSAEEARQLAAHVKDLGFTFHLRTLAKGEAESELLAREARINFFAELYHSLNAQALVLGHQADDQAETVLKRVLEGASLYALSGIKKRHDIEGMTIWRPLLPISKKDLYAYLEKNNLHPIEDPTNHDPKYMRSRMRTAIVPGLEEVFGKTVSHNLVRLGELADDLGNYLQRTSPLFRMAKTEDERGSYLDFNPYYPLDDFELKMFLKYLFIEEGINISYKSLINIQKLLSKKSKSKEVDKLIIDDGRLFLRN